MMTLFVATVIYTENTDSACSIYIYDISYLQVFGGTFYPANEVKTYKDLKEYRKVLYPLCVIGVSVGPVRMLVWCLYTTGGELQCDLAQTCQTAMSTNVTEREGEQRRCIEGEGMHCHIVMTSHASLIPNLLDY